MRVADFMDSIGICTHLNYTDGGYKNWAQVRACIDYLGVKHLRTAAPQAGGQGLSTMNLAASLGYKFCFTMRHNRTFANEIADLETFWATNPGSIAAIEGPNEVNHSPVTHEGLTGTAGAQAYQDDLFAAINASAALKDVTVLGYTDYNIVASAGDRITVHDYPRNGNMLGPKLAGIKSTCASVAPGKPIVITETGFHDLVSATPFPGTDRVTQAKLVLNALVSAPAAGIARTYIYQLLDAYPSTGSGSMETHFGLFDLAYAAKPAAVSWRNLWQIIADNGANRLTHSFSPVQPVSVAAGYKAKTLARSDGATILIVWAEPIIWDRVLKKPIAVSVKYPSIQWPVKMPIGTHYDPYRGTGARGTVPAGTGAKPPVSDRPTVVIYPPAA